MAYWIVGMGGIGSTLGARLARRHEVVFVDGWDDNVVAIRDHGLTVDYPTGETVTVRAPTVHLVDVTSIPPPDAVFLTVKSFQTEDVTRQLAAALDRHTPVVSLQNCLNPYTLLDVLGPTRSVGGMVRFDGRLEAPGHAVAMRFERRAAIGELDGSVGPRIHVLRDILASSVQTDVSSNIWGELWAKLVLNTKLNAVSAITGMGAGQIANTPTTRRLGIALAAETVRVALRLGVRLEPTELMGPPEHYLKPFGSPEMDAIEAEFSHRYGRYPDVRSSMLQDIQRGRPTEIDHMNGRVVAKGREVGVDAPLNAEIVNLVKQTEIGERKPDRRIVETRFAKLLEDSGCGSISAD